LLCVADSFFNPRISARLNGVTFFVWRN